MSYLVAVAGLAGVGKTTAVEFLSGLCSGEVVYLGAGVLESVQRLRLPETPESERTVRLELRKKRGPAAFAELKADRILELLEGGVPVMVDSIFVRAEFDLLTSRAYSFSAHLLAITASLPIRCARLATRNDRPLSRLQVEERDRLEIEVLGIGEVLAAATRTISNNGILSEFHERLTEFLRAASRN
jgi:dephospho-CoA kinase